MMSLHHSKPAHLSRRAIAATAAAALVTLAAAVAGPTWAGAPNERCAGAVERHLRGLGLEVGAVEQTSLITEYRSLEMGTTHGIQAWTSLKSCSGSLVTKLTTTCQVKETYSRGDCRVPGARRN